MAKLREQRNLIRALHDFHLNNAEYARQGVMANIGVHLGSLEEINVLAALKTRPILLSDKGKNIDVIQQHSVEYNDRAYKIGNLYKSCKDAGFIEPHIIDVPDSKNHGKTEKAHIGIAITDRGSDLLNWLGFCKISLEKYSRPVTIFWSVVVTGLLGLIGWILVHLDQLRTIFSP